MNDDSEKRVIVVDIKMPFWSMVIFMVKWAVASVPALVILAILFLLVIGLTSGMFGGFGHRFGGM